METAQKSYKPLLQRLHFVQGQITGVEKMIEDGRRPEEIYTQLRSLESAFGKSIIQAFEDYHRKELAKRLVEFLECCGGPCDDCNKLETIKKEFPKLTMPEILETLKTIETLSQGDPSCAN